MENTDTELLSCANPRNGPAAPAMPGDSSDERALVNQRPDGQEVTEDYVQRGLAGTPLTWIGGAGGRNTLDAEEGDAFGLNPCEVELD